MEGDDCEQLMQWFLQKQAEEEKEILSKLEDALVQECFKEERKLSDQLESHTSSDTRSKTNRRLSYTNKSDNLIALANSPDESHSILSNEQTTKYTLTYGQRLLFMALLVRRSKALEISETFGDEDFSFDSDDEDKERDFRKQYEKYMFKPLTSKQIS